MAREIRIPELHEGLWGYLYTNRRLQKLLQLAARVIIGFGGRTGVVMTT